MTFLPKTLVLVAALAVGSTVYAKDCGGQIRFAKGKSETVLRGKVQGNQFCEYSFVAKKGQKLRVNMGANDKPYAILMTPVNEQLFNGESFTLPKTGRYVLRVLMTRNDARKYPKTKKPYTMRFRITAR